MNHWRWNWSFVELRGDGHFSKERIKGKDKRFIRKKTLKKLRNESTKEDA